MTSSGTNLVMTVIGFAVSTLFIVFVCTRLIWARIYLTASRRSLARASGSDVGIMECGLHCLEPLEVSKFPVKKYGELCSSSKENTQCTVCLSEYHNEDMLRILPVCGHSFHSTCIDIWLPSTSRALCVEFLFGSFLSKNGTCNRCLVLLSGPSIPCNPSIHITVIACFMSIGAL